VKGELLTDELREYAGLGAERSETGFTVANHVWDAERSDKVECLAFMT
jgi:hypothetical protein